jgi:hypothetical protein
MPTTIRFDPFVEKTARYFSILPILKAMIRTAIIIRTEGMRVSGAQHGAILTTVRVVIIIVRIRIVLTVI